MKVYIEITVHIYIILLIELCTNGDIRIIGDTTSSSPSYGRVDFCVNQTWGTICDSTWTEAEASVVCRQKGFSPYGNLYCSCCPIIEVV